MTKINKIDIGIYGEPTVLKTIRLTGTGPDSRQEVIESLSVSDELSVEYDYEKDKYIVWDYDIVGYIPKAATKYFEDGESEIKINRIDENDDGKLIVYIDILGVNTANKQ